MSGWPQRRHCTMLILPGSWRSTSAWKRFIASSSHTVTSPSANTRTPSRPVSGSCSSPPLKSKSGTCTSGWAMGSFLSKSNCLEHAVAGAVRGAQHVEPPVHVHAVRAKGGCSSGRYRAASCCCPGPRHSAPAVLSLRVMATRSSPRASASQPTVSSGMAMSTRRVRPLRVLSHSGRRPLLVLADLVDQHLFVVVACRSRWHRQQEVIPVQHARVFIARTDRPQPAPPHQLPQLAAIRLDRVEPRQGLRRATTRWVHHAEHQARVVDQRTWRTSPSLNCAARWTLPPGARSSTTRTQVLQPLGRGQREIASRRRAPLPESPPGGRGLSRRRAALARALAQPAGTRARRAR